MSKYFYHGIRQSQMALDLVLDIFVSGAIKSKRKQNRSYKIGFNGPDYISVCRKGDNTAYESGLNNSYEHYIFNCFCFIISDEIPAVQGEYIPDLISWNRFDLYKFMNENPERRITDMFDEWQVKDEISFKHIIGIGIPWNWLSKFNDEYIQNTVQLIINHASGLGLDIINSSIPGFIENYEKEKQEALKRII